MRGKDYKEKGGSREHRCEGSSARTPTRQRLANRVRSQCRLTSPYPNPLFPTSCLGYGIPLRDREDDTDEKTDGPYSDDEMLTHKGLRRSQSMKSVKTIKGRKEVSPGQGCDPDDR